jgi:hypothetical protein
MLVRAKVDKYEKILKVVDAKIEEHIRTRHE